MVEEHGKGFRSYPVADVINGGPSSVVRGGGGCLGVAEGASSGNICPYLLNYGYTSSNTRMSAFHLMFSDNKCPMWNYLKLFIQCGISEC